MGAQTTNSVKQFYVANGYNTGATTPGYIKSAKKTSDNKLYLTYINSEGNEYKTADVNLDNIRYVKVTPASARTLRKDEITFDAPVAGQTYIVRVLFRQWGSGSSEDQYFKHFGSYKAKTGDDQEDLVDALVASAEKNFSREPVKLLSITKSGTGASTKLVVEEVAQPWVRGKQQGRPLNYVIQFVKITDANGENSEWGTITNVAAGNQGVGTGHLVADSEYFYLGERGDIYRNVGYPFTFDTTYFVDPTKNYSTIDIAYFDSEPHNGNAVQSEKVLTVVCVEGTDATTYNVQIAVAGAINTAVGSTLVQLLENP